MTDLAQRVDIDRTALEAMATAGVFSNCTDRSGTNLDRRRALWVAGAVAETSADLALLLAIVSSYRDRALPADLVTFGEVGLSGEIRPVPSGGERLIEAAKHGFRRAIVPAANVPRKPIEGMEIVGVARLSEALEAL